MKKNIISYFFLILSLILNNVFSQDTILKNEFQKKIKISFQPLEKKFYQDQPIFFRVNFQNLLLKKNFRFKYFANSFIQFKFSIKKKDNSIPNQNLGLDAFEYNRDEKNFNLIEGKNYKIVELKFEEIFSSKIDITQFFELNQVGVYQVTGFFYPLGNLNFLDENEKNYRIAIEPFSFKLKNPLFTSLNNLEKNLLESPSSTPNPANLEKINLAYPQKTIKNHIQALRNKDWNRYISTLQIDTLLEQSYNNTIYFERYVGAFPEEKKYVLEDFKKFLIQNLTFEVDEFLILKTTIDKNSTAQVDVYYTLRDAFEKLSQIKNDITDQETPVWIKENKKEFIKKYLYSYQLKNYNNIWKIISWETKIIKGLEEEINKPFPQTKSLADLEEMELLGNILFNYNKDEISEESYEFLNQLSLYLIHNPNLKIRLEGHTDNQGRKTYNQNLSRRRSEKVYAYLLEKGISENRINYGFSGEERPIKANTSPAGKKANRRVEIFLFQ